MTTIFAASLASEELVSLGANQAPLNSCWAQSICCEACLRNHEQIGRPTRADDWILAHVSCQPHAATGFSRAAIGPLAAWIDQALTVRRLLCLNCCAFMLLALLGGLTISREEISFSEWPQGSYAAHFAASIMAHKCLSFEFLIFCLPT